MLTELDYHESTATRKIIAHVSDAESSNTSLTNILAIIDFILIGVKAIFFTEMGKPKSKLQIALSIPAIIRFISEVVKRINKDVKKPSVRVKGISTGANVADAVEKAVNQTKIGDPEYIDINRKINKSLSDPNSKKGAK